MKAPWILVLALIAVIGTGVAWRKNFQLRATRATRAESTTIGARLAAETLRTQQQLGQSTARRAQLEQELARLASVPKAAAPNPARRPSTPTELAIQLSQFKSRLAARYSPFYREMRFTSEQATKFEGLLTEQEGRQLDLLAATTGGAVALSPAEMMKLRLAEATRVEAEQRQLLGDDGYDHLQEYRGSEGRRRVVRDLVSGLALSSSPLSMEQEGQMRHVLADLDFDDRGGADREHWRPVIERAQAFLTPGQMVELQVVASKSQGLAALNEMSRLVQAAKNSR